MRFTDKEISIETAKLLGVVFWCGTPSFIYKFEHTPIGPRLWLKSLSPGTITVLGGEWRPASSYSARRVAKLNLHLVELDEKESTDALHT